MNIYEKMSAVTAEISTVAKNLSVGYGQNQYKAVGEADVLAAVKPAEQKNGIYSFPYSREIVDAGIMENVDSKGNTKKQQFLRIKTTYRFINIDDPKEYIDIDTFGDGVDSQDKAPGKAMTYGDKYALLKAYKIITGDDPDQHYSEELKGVQHKKAAYPSREKMISFMLEKMPVTLRDKFMAGYQVSGFDEMSDEQVMASYRWMITNKDRWMITNKDTWKNK